MVFPILVRWHLYIESGPCRLLHNDLVLVGSCIYIWVRSRNCGCLVTWFCYLLIAKPGNKTATVSWPDPYDTFCQVEVQEAHHIYSFCISCNHKMSGYDIKVVAEHFIITLHQSNTNYDTPKFACTSAIKPLLELNFTWAFVMNAF